MEVAYDEFGKRFPVPAVGAAIAAAILFSEPARAEVSVNINLGPPPIVVSAPPAVVMIRAPRSTSFRTPRSTCSSTAGTGGRRAASSGTVPGSIRVLEGDRAATGAPGGGLHAADYRTRYEREHQVPYGQWKKERSRYDRENRKAHKKWRRSARRVEGEQQGSREERQTQ